MYSLLFAQLALIVFWAIYDVFLRQETHHSAKRFYLLFSLVFVLVFPFVNWQQAVAPNVTPAIELPAISIGEANSESGFSIGLSTWLLLVFSVGTVIVFLRNALSVLKILRLSKTAERVSHFHPPVYYSETNSSFSFFQYVFISRDLSKEEAKWIYQHEKAHQQALHSYDVVFLALLECVFWINPVFWMMKKRLIEVHEHQADLAMVRTKDRIEYQELLVAKALNVSAHQLAHHFIRQSLLKNRIMMMNRNPSSSKTLAKFASLFLVASLFIGVASCSKESKSITPETTVSELKSGEQPEPEYDVAPEYKGGQEALFSFLVNELKYPVNAKEKGAEGKAFVQFEILPNGEIANATILRSSKHNDLDEEALRVVEMMPKWTPAQKDGQNIKTKMTLPIQFQLTDDEKAAENNDTEQV